MHIFFFFTQKKGYITETSPYKSNPDLHLTYTCSKNGGNLGLVLKMKNIACISILLTKHVKYTFFYICLNLCIQY